MIASPRLPNEFAKPVMQVRLNRVFVPTWHVEVEQTAYSVADTVLCDTYLAGAPIDYGRLSQRVIPCPFEVYVGSADALTKPQASSRLLYALLDEIDTTYETDTIELRARGVLALLIDQRMTARVDMNVTVDAVMSRVITQYGYGLTPKVTPTSVQIGKVLGDDYVALGRNVRVFDFLVMLADFLGWTIRLQGTTVVVGPPPVRGQVPVFNKSWNRDAGEKLRITHSALHSRNIKVFVRSYLPGKKARVTSSVSVGSGSDQSLWLPSQATPNTPISSGPAGRQSGFTSVGSAYPGEVYSFHIPGLTSTQCDQMAAKIRDDLTKREFIAELTFTPSPSEIQTLVSAGTEFLVTLSGCSHPSHNQTYHPRKVTWSYDTGEDDASQPLGLKVTVLMVNHDVPSPSGGL